MENKNKKPPFEQGSRVQFAITVTRKDIARFAEISGDFSPNHVDDAFMKNSKYGKIIAHGALLVAYMSRASSMIIDEYESPDNDSTPVSLGYDRIRFIKPVFIDDIIKVSYTIAKYDLEAKRSYSEIVIKNQEDEIVAVAGHILKWVPNQ